MKDGVEWRYMPDGVKVCERMRGGAENFKGDREVRVGA